MLIHYNNYESRNFVRSYLLTSLQQARQAGNQALFLYFVSEIETFRATGGNLGPAPTLSEQPKRNRKKQPPKKTKRRRQKAA